MELTGEPDELAAALLAEEERQLVRVRRRQVIGLLALGNDLARGMGIAPRELPPTPVHPGGTRAERFCRELMAAIESNLDTQLERLRAQPLPVDQRSVPQSSREADLLAADRAQQQRQQNAEITRLTTGARRLQSIVSRLRTRINPDAVRWWRTERDRLIDRVHATRQPGKPPVCFVFFDGGRVLLPYDSPDRWIAVIADGVADGAEAAQVLTRYQATQAQAMPPEASRRPEYVMYRAEAERQEETGNPWQGPADPYLANYDPAARH